MNKLMEAVMRVRPILQKGAQMLSNEEALQIKGIYPTWEELVELGSVEAEAGYKFLKENDLYFCINPNPTFQADWVPGVNTASLYTRIDETHAGTLSDPIPYDGNMELKNGLYYSQNGVIYYCNRDTGVPVFNALADLVGIYVVVS